MKDWSISVIDKIKQYVQNGGNCVNLVRYLKMNDTIVPEILHANRF